jgi:hypothetical protein
VVAIQVALTKQLQTKGWLAKVCEMFGAKTKPSKTFREQQSW